jgi:hypothetical protein
VELAKELDTIYIAPHLLLYPNLDELYKPLDGVNYLFQVERQGQLVFDSLLTFKRLMVLAEPGYGKSALLTQIGKAYPDAGCGQVTCKELKSKSIEALLGSDAEITKLQYVLFDALDEVDANFATDTIRSIQAFVDAYPDITAVISCRTHYLSRFQSYFTGLQAFKFLKISAFFDSDIRNYLLHYLPDADDAIEQLIQKTKVSNYRSVLATPRYLRAFVVALKNDSLRLSELADLKIIELFDKLIYHKLEDDARQNPDRYSKNEAELTRRVLEKLSLIMEIYQTNAISKEELITVLDETVSNVNLIFLNYSSIDTFIERILKQTDDILEFENTEFQEYLAARHLVRMANKEQALYDLILDPDLQHIYPGWYDVLRFAVEISPGIILNLARYLSANQNFQVDEKLIDIILSIPPEQLPEAERAFLFDTLAGYYEKSGQYIGQRYFTVARFFSPVLNNAFTDTLPGDGMINRVFSNIIYIIRGIVATGKMPEASLNVWRDYLVGQFAGTASDDVIDSIGFVLEGIDAFEQLKGLWPAITGRIDKVMQSYLITLFRTHPEDPFCLDVLTYVIQSRPNIDASEMIDKLAGKENLHSFFDFLLSDAGIPEKALRGESTHGAFVHLFEKIGRLDDRELDKKVGRLFSGMLHVKDHYHLYGGRRQFAEQMVAHYWRREPIFLDQLLTLSNAAHFLSEYGNVIAEQIDAADFEKIRECLVIDGHDWELRTIIAKLKVFGDERRQEVLERIKIAHPEYFEEQTYHPLQPQPQIDKADVLYNEYRGYLELHRTQNLVYEELLIFVYRNWDVLSARSTPEETDQVRGLLVRTLDRLDPENFRLEIQRSGNRSSYAYNSHDWFHFDLLISLAIALGVSDAAQTYRQKIIRYLPLVDSYMSNADRLNIILNRIKPISADEVQSLLEFCLKRQDDYIYSATLSFIDLIREQNLPVFAPILALYIEDGPGKTDFSEKSKALDAYAAITAGTAKGESFLQELIEARSADTQGDIYLRQRANAHLITYYEDDAAITWRIEQLKTKIMRVDENSITLSRRVNYTASMNEMEQPTYGKCFIENPSPKAMRPMFDLLTTSFELLKQPDAKRYSNYLQRIAFDYFNAVKKVALINELRAFVDDERFESRGASFKYLLKQLEMNFIDENRKFINIAEAVQAFNELNAKRYLRVRDEADLAWLLQQVVNEDVRNVIENEGFYHLAQRLAGNISYKRSKHLNEDMIQRTLKVILENALLKRGLRTADIQREPELLDGKRYDYLIKYGFIGPIVFELKKLDNPEITDPEKRRAYKTKIRQYLSGVNSRYGFYLVFKVLDDANGAHKEQFDNLVKEYRDIKGLYIEFLDCFEPAKELLAAIAEKKAEPETEEIIAQPETTTEPSAK